MLYRRSSSIKSMAVKKGTAPIDAVVASSSSALNARGRTALNYYHWTSIYEWILGYVPYRVLSQELSSHTRSRGGEERIVGQVEGDDDMHIEGRRGCPVPPPVMTTLMKELLPIWVRALRRFAHREVVRRRAWEEEGRRRARQRRLVQQQQQQQQQQRRNDGLVDGKRERHPVDGSDDANGKEDEEGVLGIGWRGGDVGLAHVALRYGMQVLFEFGEEDGFGKGGGDDDSQRQIYSYARLMTRLLRDVREIILPSVMGGGNARGRNDGGGGKKGGIFGIDAKAEFFAVDIMQNLTRLSRLAPPFDATVESTQSIIDARDGHVGVGPIEVASVEARRILFLLLADTRRSPFLIGAHQNRSKSMAGQSTKGEDRSTQRLSQISIALHGVLANHGNCPSTKVLLGMCLRNTSELVPHFFRGLQLSDPKASYRSLAALTFVEDVVREAPLPPLWSNTLPTELIPSAIIPPCISKNLLGRIVQNPSALLASSGLKLIITLLRRGRVGALTYMTKAVDGESPKQLRNYIVQAVICHLPDVALLLSIPSRFDPFENHRATSTSSANSIVVLQLCEALHCYAQLDSTLLTAVKYDWTKLVPTTNDGRAFSCAEPLLQLRILQTLLALSRLSKSHFSPKMLPNVISALISTNIPEVYTNARRLAVRLMKRNLFSDFAGSDVEVGQCNEYESSLWIDGISAEIIDKLVRSMEEAKQHRVEQKIMVSQALIKASLGCAMPRLGISSFLVWSVSKLLLDRESTVSSDKLSLLTLQVATSMLLYLADPMPFAAIISWQIQGSQGINPRDNRIAGLYHVAKSILRRDAKTYLIIESLTSDVFCPSNSQIYNVDEKELSNYADATLMRQCLSMMNFSRDHNAKLNILLRKILIGIIQAGNVSGIASRLGFMFNSHFFKTAETETIVLLALSAPTTRQNGVEIFDLLNRYDKIKPESIAMEVASALLRSSLVEVNHESAFLSDVLRFCNDAFKLNVPHTSNLKHFLLMILIHVMPVKEKSTSFPFLSGAIFDLWTTIAGNLTSNMSIKICLRLENWLSTLFVTSTCEHGAWIVYHQRVCRMTPKVFVNLWLNTIDAKESSECTASLLQSVLIYDCSQFCCIPSLFTSIANDSKMAKLWDSGALDAVAATFVLQTNKQKAAKDIITSSSWAEMASIVGRRFLVQLAKTDQDQMIGISNLSFGVILDALEAICSNQLLIFETQKRVLSRFERIRNLPTEHEVQMIRLAAIVCVKSIHGSYSTLLLTKAFLRCCELVPKLIKKMIRNSSEAAARSLESMFCMLSSFIGNAPSFDENIVARSSNTIDSCIVACLKYGIMETNNTSSCSIFGGCLKIVRLLIRKVHDPSLSSQVALGSLTSSQVHAMVVSHSSFHIALSHGTRDVTQRSMIPNDSTFCHGLTQQSELIRLLLYIVSSAGREVKIDIDTWTTILSVYNASTDVVDCLLRRLMFLYETYGCCQDEITMNDLRWGPIATKHINNVSEEESWEWFIKALDIDRIRCTLCQYPIADTLEPSCNNDVECTEQKIKHVEQLVSSDDIDDVTDDDRSSVTSQRDTSDADATRDNRDVVWRGAGDDLRYSPGFVLPLILATLEAYSPHKKENNDIYEENGEDCHVFGNTCRRVSEKGGISLALASLSSRCPSIRQVAIAICGLFLKGLKMQESHGIKSWRERPQQEMLMSSIQRGLSVRRAIQVQKRDTNEGIVLDGMTTETRINIPMLPAVSAVFLAKALMVLSKPGDDMYAQMNRYFLRLTDYHGAFQDCFALPAFLSLYCSSSDELSRCRTEQRWALLNLRDSAVDDYCYRIISQHHVPELIMSSFDGMIDDPERTSELCLTIDAIETLIQSGGVRASNHLLKGQGLLSWLHGVVGWRKISSVFPYVALKCKFINLITTAVNSYRCTVHGDNDGDLDEAQTFYEKVPLANVVIRLCLDDSHTVGQGDLSPDSLTLLGSTCNALWEIYLAGRHGQFTSASCGTISLCDMTSLLMKFIRHREMFEKVLSSICDLPLVRSEKDLSSAILFSSLALDFILETNAKLLPDTILLTMKRVNELMERNHCIREDAKITAQIIKCRQLAVIFGGIHIWNSFLPFVENLVDK
ncbi:hypothetical protein ACHAXA_009878 [Cyclostephanos tholiformis]|uniref:URB1 C-terminal domain-containing protein n=1 Tax=Cyclostephanos tholiformis TaxID=382380 RepID=A0ABD3R4D2_9STRA